MTDASTLPATLPGTPLQCLQIWGEGGNVEQALALPGVDAWVYARAWAESGRGGDVHFVSTCGHGLIARFAVADVAGHGQHSAPLARRLRQLMRRHINELDQTEFLRVLNQEYLAQATHGRYATALLASFHRPTRHLVVCNAGHPRPLWYRSATRAWQLVDFDQALPPAQGLNLPLGIVAPTSYQQIAFPLSPGDLIVLYSDGYSESPGAQGLIGERGLLALARDIDVHEPAAFGAALNAALQQQAGAEPAADDRTLLVIRPHFEEPPPLSVAERLRVLGRMVGLLPV